MQVVLDLDLLGYAVVNDWDVPASRANRGQGTPHVPINGVFALGQDTLVDPPLITRSGYILPISTTSHPGARSNGHITSMPISR